MIRNGLWGVLWLLFMSAPPLCAQDAPGTMAAWFAEPWTRDGFLHAAPHPFAAQAAYTAPLLAPPAEEWWFRSSVVPSTFEEPLIPPPSPSFDPVDPVAAPSCTTPTGPSFPLIHTLWEDQRGFYSWTSQRFVLLSIAAGGTLANTTWDQHFQDDVKFSQAVHGFKFLGDGRIMLPTFAAAAAVGHWFDEGSAGSLAGQWGGRSLRAAMVGAPQLLFLQYMLGGSRPEESPLGSHWHPFADNNGVSGHAFIGSLGFLTAAKLTERPLLKATFYVGSWMAGASRIVDEDHYLSQVVIGWTIGAVAVAAVHQTETGVPPRLFPWVTPGGVGIGYYWSR